MPNIGLKTNFNPKYGLKLLKRNKKRIVKEIKICNPELTKLVKKTLILNKN